MGRPPETGRRAKTLESATDYVLEHGMANLSLRPLAAALGTSTRMLLYDFGSKEQLVAAVLAEVRLREASLLADALRDALSSPADLIRGIWAWISDGERKPFLRLFFEVYMDAMTHPDAYEDGGRAMVSDWLERFSAAFRVVAAGHDDIDVTLVIAAVRGLLLDRLVTGDFQRTDKALEHFAALFE
ncbi:TetR/AcrR family transcriptional regulator [Amycolatopsis sp. NPDC059090]|uniref:TetR/AcrR family transcriptional regulator n=1 Tax=unclassified Amycolatopsis TaxID=2618356 RepID=UPI003671DC07